MHARKRLAAGRAVEILFTATRLRLQMTIAMIVSYDTTTCRAQYRFRSNDNGKSEFR
jgi:hypothetical protein